MATRIVKSNIWNPEDLKYGVTIDAMFDIVSVVGNTATVSVVGNYIIQQTEHGSEMPNAPASDYAFLFEGEVTPGQTGSTIPGDHYMEPLPTLFGGSAEQYRSKMLLEFRGDTYRADGGNFTNLWTKSDGLVINRKFGNTTTRIPINTTISVDISSGGQAAILSWVTTYVTFAPTVYRWGSMVAWVSLDDLDYRPGAVLGATEGVWLSHNRAGKAAHILADTSNTAWQEMRTIAGGSGGKGTPPSILSANDSNTWFNQKRLGKN